MKPSLGRIVMYQLTESDARKINRRRVPNATMTDNWVPGSVAHVGKDVGEADIFPAIVVGLNYESVDAPTGTEHDLESINLQVFLDGNDTFWATGVKQLENVDDPDAGKWYWPPRV